LDPPKLKSGLVWLVAVKGLKVGRLEREVKRLRLQQEFLKEVMVFFAVFLSECENRVGAGRGSGTVSVWGTAHLPMTPSDAGLQRSGTVVNSDL